MTGCGRPTLTDPAIWEKWDPSGNARTFRGTSFVAHVVPDSPFHLLGRRILDDIRAEGIEEKKWADTRKPASPSKYG